MKKIIPFLFMSLLLGLITACVNDAEKLDNTKIVNNNDSLSYTLGVNIGNDFKTQDVEINIDVFAKGLKDGISGEYDFSDSVLVEILNDFQLIMNDKFQQEQAVAIEQNKIEGAKFLIENKENQGVITLPGGLQYKVIKEGSGIAPSPNDSVMIHYRAMFIDGNTFDQSYDRGLIGIRLSNVIQGLSEGVQLMKQGSIYELYISSQLAYGDEDFANLIPGGSTLIYRIELVEIVK